MVEATCGVTSMQLEDCRIYTSFYSKKYQNGTAVGPQFRLSGTKMDIARRLDFELAVLNLED